MGTTPRPKRRSRRPRRRSQYAHALRILPLYAERTARRTVMLAWRSVPKRLSLTRASAKPRRPRRRSQYANALGIWPLYAERTARRTVMLAWRSVPKRLSLTRVSAKPRRRPRRKSRTVIVRKTTAAATRLVVALKGLGCPFVAVARTGWSTTALAVAKKHPQRSRQRRRQRSRQRRRPQRRRSQQRSRRRPRRKSRNVIVRKTTAAATRLVVALKGLGCPFVAV